MDELNSVVGVALAFAKDHEIIQILTDIQNRLFVLGADLAAPPGVNEDGTTRIIPDDAVSLERIIDSIDERLSPLKSFILPGGSKTAAMLHHARSVCRRAERLVVTLCRSGEVSEHTVIYLNRLSDLLFELARYANVVENVADVPWNSGKHGGRQR